ncbi:MAG: PLP-dependent aminotransferase family protein [Rhodoferax sp.]|uniref:MocR-like pyridoxine biosynthesis transcription factor PdxR n=1 Tax=Rhodoferax sp. TaxID=50421 RepID=UPI003265526C
MASKPTQPALIGDLPLGTPAPGEGLQRWLHGALRRAILDGRLPANSILPSTRSLALQHGLARGTVQAAYDQLMSEGYLLTRPGSGTRVSHSLPDLALHAGPAPRRMGNGAPGAPAHPATPTGPWLQRLAGLEPAFPLGAARSGNTPPQPFAPHRCDVRAFPIDLWRQLHARQLRPSRLHTLWDGDPAGLLALRQAIAAHLAIARGVAVSAAQIVVVGSVQQALDLCTRLLLAPGDAVWMEDPGYPGARQILLAAGAQVVDVPVDADGLRVADGMRLAPQARLACVTPSRQAPLGVALSPERRLALLRWATEHQACIFEDDYDSEYRFVAQPIPALASLPGAAAHVVLAGTFSKLLFPALRLAYVALPLHLVEPFQRAASLTARHANGLAQAVLADFVADGHFDRHVRRMRKIYAARAAAFEQAAHTHWRGLIEVPTVQAGLDVVGRLVGMDEATAVKRLAQAGITAAPLGRYTSSHCVGQGLVMGFAPFDEAAIEQAARQMAVALRR